MQGGKTCVCKKTIDIDERKLKMTQTDREVYYCSLKLEERITLWKYDTPKQSNQLINVHFTPQN